MVRLEQFYIITRYNLLDHKNLRYKIDQFKLLDTLYDEKEAIEKYEAILLDVDTKSEIEKKESGECEKWWDVETLRSQFRELKSNKEYKQKWLAIELLKTPMNIKDIRIQDGISYFNGYIYGTNDPNKCKTCLDVVDFCSCGYD